MEAALSREAMIGEIAGFYGTKLGPAVAQRLADLPDDRVSNAHALMQRRRKAHDMIAACMAAYALFADVLEEHYMGQSIAISAMTGEFRIGYTDAELAAWKLPEGDGVFMIKIGQ